MARGSAQVPLLINPGGVREDVGLDKVPPGAWLEAENWFTRLGSARTRPGYSSITTVASADRVLGFGYRGDPHDSNNLVIHTATKAYSFAGAVLTDITGTWTTSTGVQPVRFVAFPTGGTLYLARTNHANAMDIWPGTGAFVNPTGTPPKALDICVVSSRIMLVNTIDTTDNPVQVRWSGFNDINSWPTGSSNSAELSETSDIIVACAALGPNSAAIYKDDSVWVAQAVAAKVAFTFHLVEAAPGPLGPGALIVYKGAHYWLARDGVIYRFDGTRVATVSAGVAQTFRGNFEWSGKLGVHGMAITLPEPELWWFYPVVGTATLIRAISLNLTTGAVTPHLFLEEITASGGWISLSNLTWDSAVGTWDDATTRYGTWNTASTHQDDSAIFGHTDGRVSQFGLVSQDNGAEVPWFYTTGWNQIAPGKAAVVDGVMSYWKTEANSLPVTVSVTVTDNLGEQERETERIYDVATDDNHFVSFPNTRGQFVKVKQSGEAGTAAMAHRGGLLFGWPRSVT